MNEDLAALVDRSVREPSREGFAAISNAREVSLPWWFRLLRKLPFPHKLGLFERLLGSALHRHGLAWVVVSSGYRWLLDLSEPTQRWCVYGDYEGPEQMRWLRAWLANGGVVVDSGANYGQTVQYFAALPGVRTLAFEPTALARESLEESVRRNAIESVEVVGLGLSDVTAAIEIQVDGARSTLESSWYRDRHLPTEIVSVKPLDDIAKARGINRIRLWKLDVEGHELRALRGARSLLEAQRIDAVLVECRRSNLEELTAFLGSVGYRLHMLVSGTTIPASQVQPAREMFNAVALPDPNGGGDPAPAHGQGRSWALN